MGTSRSGGVSTRTVVTELVRLELERKRGRPKAVLELMLPRGWRTGQAYGLGTLEPIEQPDPRMYTSLGFRVVRMDPPAAGADKSLDAVAARVKAARRTHLQYAERPNINTGKPELDAVRAEVEVIEDEEIPGGWSHILRVRYAYELVSKGPYRPYVSVRCWYLDITRDHKVELFGRLPLAAERDFLPDVQSVCRSVAVLEAE